MTIQNLENRAQSYLHQLCVTIPSRSVGSAGNRLATEFFARTAASFGLHIERTSFQCMDWKDNGSTLVVEGTTYPVFTSPYSLPVNAHAPLCSAESIHELENTTFAGKILLLHGELTREQLMPRHFPFWNPEEHQRIYRLIEANPPLAIIAATSRNPELTGALYPFPLFEDGDFDIPSVYTTEEEGARLLQQVGSHVQLEIISKRIPAIGENIIARTTTSHASRVVITAHIDSKAGTPGALDNASGVTILLLLAELLQQDTPNLNVELVALNGEDYYAASGEKLYLEQNAEKFGNIILAINMDEVGFQKSKTAYSFYAVPQTIQQILKKVLLGFPELYEGEPWFQGDHMIFVQQQVPALALVSENFLHITSAIAHTEKDTVDLVNPHTLAVTTVALQQIITELCHNG